MAAFEKKAKYHPSTPGGIYVYTAEEEAALGPDWVDTPALLPAAPAAPKGGDPLEIVGDAIIVTPFDDAVQREAEERAGDGEFGATDPDPWAGVPKKRKAK